jgi:gluconolactonase
MAAGLNKLRNSGETLDTKPGIHVYSPAGKLLRLIPISQDLITNCTFGGPDMKTLYVTAGRDLLDFQNTVPGTRR